MYNKKVQNFLIPDYIENKSHLPMMINTTSNRNIK